MQRLGLEHGEAIESGMVSRVIENAQRKVEGQNFDTRKSLLEYDDVANDQRRVVYQQRNELLESDDISETIAAMREDVLAAVISEHIPPNSVEEQWDVSGLEAVLVAEFNLRLPIQQWLDDEDDLDEQGLRDRISERLAEAYRTKEQEIGPETLREVEKSFLLQILDSHWKEHLAAMDFLRQGIGLRGMAQRDPKREFKREAFEMFSKMLDSLKREVIKILCHVQVQSEEDARAAEQERHRKEQAAMRFRHAGASGFDDNEDEQAETEADGAGDRQPYVRGGRKVGRNESCPCGSGYKYKQCHGKLAG